MANTLIIVGLLPALLWLFLLGVSIFHPEDFPPWVSAGIIMFGVPLGMISFCVAVPMMLLARNRAAANPTVWTRIYRVPFFLGVTTFTLALIAGVWLVINNIHR